MSKKGKVDKIKALIKGEGKPEFQMKIFIQAKSDDKKEFYKAIPFSSNCDVTCPDKEKAEKLFSFLKK